MTLLNRNPLGLFTPGAIIHGAKKANIISVQCVDFFAMKQDVQSDSSLDHMHGAAAVAQEGKERWRCFKNQCKQTQKKSIPSDSEREQSGCRVLIIFGIWEQIYSHMFLI